MIWVPQCSLCLERPSSHKNHVHTQCPLIGTLNKIWSHLEFEPLCFENGVFVRVDRKVPVEVDKMLRDLRERVAKLEEAVGKLQAKQLPLILLPPYKRRSGRWRTADNPPPKQAKQGGGQGKRGASGSGQNGGGGQGGQGKGKGKAKE